MVVGFFPSAQSAVGSPDVGAAASAVRFGNRLVLPVSQHLAGQKGIIGGPRESCAWPVTCPMARRRTPRIQMQRTAATDSD